MRHVGDKSQVGDVWIGDGGTLAICGAEASEARSPAAAPSALAGDLAGLETPRSGSRFDPLAESEVDEEISVAEEVAWCGLEDEPRVLPIVRDGDQGRDEILQDFWAKIGYPDVVSRPWEKAAGSAASVGVAAPRRRSLSPPGEVLVPRGRSLSSSPPGMRMPRPPVRLKAWKGPLPPKRITPPAILADFVNAKKIGAVASATTSLVGGGHSSPETVVPLAPAVRPRFEPPEAGATQGGLQSRWAGFAHALMGLQRDPRRTSRPTDVPHTITLTDASSRTDSLIAVSTHDLADLRRSAVGSSPSP
jgi:hypothetical protein